MNEQSKKADEDFRFYCRTRDPAALARVFDATAGRLLVAASHMCRDNAAAEDLVQLTFVQAIESADAFDRSQPVLPWLLGILSHRAKDEIRKRERRGRLLEQHGASTARDESVPQADPALVAETEEELRLLAAAIDELPKSHRQVLNLRLAHGLGPTEIAHALDRPLATVKSQLARGARQLREILPASLVPALTLFFTPERGLAAIRSEVLAGAATVTPTFVFLGGVLKKVSLAGALAALVLGMIWLADDHVMESPPNRGTVGARLEPGGAGRPAGADDEPAGTSETRRETATRRNTLGASARTGTLGLRVLWEDGSAAQNLEVCVFPAHDRNGRRTGARLRSDATGHVPDAKLPTGRHRVYLSAEASTDVVIDADRRRDVVLRLPFCGVVSGIVLDTLGQPIAGAAIRHQDDTQSITNVLAHSDANGAFTSRAWSSHMSLFATKDGYGRSARESLRSLRHERHHIVLQLAAGATTLHGRVVGPAGEPVPGADVRANVPAPNLGNTISLEVGNSMDRHVRTDGDGRFELPNVGAGEVELLVLSRGHTPRRLETEHVPGAEQPIEVRLAAASTVTGQVLAPDGSPVAGARIQMLLDGRPGYLPATTSDAGGRFELHAPPSEGFDVQVEHGRWGSMTHVVMPDGGPIRLRFSATPRVFGRVLLPSGAPAEGWWVRATAFTDRRVGAVDSRCDEKGRFCISHENARHYRLVVQQARGGSRLGCLVSAARPSERELVLQLTAGAMPSAWVRGRVVRPEGFGEAGLRVSMSDRDRDTWLSAAVQDDGTFAVGPAPAGTYELRVRPRMSGVRAKVIGSRTLRGGEIVDIGTVRLAPTTDVALAVSMQGGGIEPPLSVVLLRVESADAEQPGTSLHFSGTWFRGWDRPLRPMPAGKYLLRVVAGPRNLPSRHELELRAGQRTVVPIALPALRTVVVRLQGTKGARVPAYATFTLERAQGPTGIERLMFQPGRERVQGLPPGDYVLRLYGEPGLEVAGGTDGAHRFRVAGSGGTQSELVLLAPR